MNQQANDGQRDNDGEANDRGQAFVHEFGGSPHSGPPTDPQRNPEDEDSEESPSEIQTAMVYWLGRYWAAPREKSKWADIAMVVLTLLVAIAAFASAHIFERQLKESQKATRISLESFRVDERAWIEIDPIKPILKATASGGFGAMFTYNIYPRNVGKTAAYDITAKAIRGAPMSGLSLGDNADQIGRYQSMLLNDSTGIPEIEVSRRLPKTLGPGMISLSPFDIYGQEPQVFKNGSIYQFLIGRIDYTDAFLVKHWATFCFFISDASGNIQYCQEGNDKDRNPELPPN